jgi:hypothetical protein
MISAIGTGTDVAAMLGLARQRQATPTDQRQAAQQSAGAQAKQDFLDYAKETPQERMEDNWLRAHGLDRKKLAAMNAKDREKIMRQMKQEIEQALQRQTENKAHVDLIA